MQFLNPIWFTALAALSIPVVIHLWNIRPGKTLKVGSISIFEESSPASSRSLKLLDILLLILRCLLLALIAFLLAAPFWRRQTGDAAKGWMLIPRGYFNEAYKQYRGKVDSLTRKGYQFHYFNAGFPQEKLDEVLKNAPQRRGNDSTNYWNLAAHLDKQLPANIPAEVFVPNTTIHFQGNPAAVSHHFNWNTFTLADSVRTWLPNAWVTYNGGIRVVEGTSKPFGIAYQYAEIQNGNNNALFDVKTDNGKTSVHLKDADSIQTAVDNREAILAIFTGNNDADANYLRAALEASTRFMLKRVLVKVYHQPEAIPANADWLFWLSDAAVQAKQAAHVLYYATGKVSADHSWLVNGDGEHPQLFKSIIANKTGEQPVWTDGFGNVVLRKKSSGNSEEYALYTHFNPTWNDLVWSDAFPNWLLQLLTPETAIAAKYDTRLMDQQQLQTRMTEGRASFQTQAGIVNLSSYVWFVLAALFFAERWLSHKNQLSNG
jgi:hypothetical protein